MMKKLLNNLPFFKKKEEKKKSEAMSAMETGIDDMFKGTGLVGGIVGGLAKKVGNALLSSMEEAASDVDKLQRTAKLWIERDQACASSIGYTLSMNTSQSIVYMTPYSLLTSLPSSPCTPLPSLIDWKCNVTLHSNRQCPPLM